MLHGMQAPVLLSLCSDGLHPIDGLVAILLYVPSYERIKPGRHIKAHVLEFDNVED